MTFKATGEIVSADKIHTFQETMGTPFVNFLIRKPFQAGLQLLVLCQHWQLAIFDPSNVASTDSSQFSTYGKKSIEVLFNHYGKDKFALT